VNLSTDRTGRHVSFTLPDGRTPGGRTCCAGDGEWQPWRRQAIEREEAESGSWSRIRCGAGHDDRESEIDMASEIRIDLHDVFNRFR